MRGDAIKIKTVLMGQTNKIATRENVIHGCSIVVTVVVFIKHGNAVRKFPPEMIHSLKSNSILSFFKDGDYDCTNKADEENCNVTSPTNLPNVPDIMTPTCHDWMFRCQNDRCVPYWWKCDGMEFLKVSVRKRKLRFC